jgi:hypothetical protein
MAGVHPEPARAAAGGGGFSLSSLPSSVRATVAKLDVDNSG